MTRAKDISKIVTDANLSGTLDVTGAVTAGGLTVEKSAAVGATFNRLTSSGHTIDVQVVGNTVGSLGSDVGGQGMFNIDAVTAGVSSGKILLTTNDVRRQLIDNNGDISFYEDTGTTPKLFWDASAESLGIGTSSPSKRLHLYATNDAASVRFENTASAKVWDITPARPNVANTGLSIYNVTDDRTDFHIDNNGNVGIGTTSPSSFFSDSKLVVGDGTGTPTATIYGSTTGTSYLLFADGTLSTAAYRGGLEYSHASDFLGFFAAGAERMRIDSSGNLLVGKTAIGIASVGGELRADGQITGTKDGGISLALNRKTSDGDIAGFYKDGSAVGSISSNWTNSTDFTIKSSTSRLILQDNGGEALAWDGSFFHPWTDDAIDLGYISNRWDDVYATNGTIQTSDRNEKQDIEELTEAEQRVAVVAKGLMRKFRWIDSVAEKGDNARTHFGIIAQDLQDAFTAEGLDANKYAMFTSNTWWELDGKTYKTEEEAPEGATEKTRLGVRYNQLLAFIISAI
jgi:hypothetical protein